MSQIKRFILIFHSSVYNTSLNVGSLCIPIFNTIPIPIIRLIKELNNNTIASVKNGNFISEPQTDFIYSIVGEELGFVGAAAVIILLLLISLECLWIAKHAKDLSGKIICVHFSKSRTANQPAKARKYFYKKTLRRRRHLMSSSMLHFLL